MAFNSLPSAPPVTGVFPGRFQPFTNAHLERIEKICAAHENLRLCVLVGEVGELNQANFLTVPERVQMIEEVLFHQGLSGRVFVRYAKGAEPEIWAQNVRRAVPEAKIVFSDNPFVCQPLAKAGFLCETHERSGIEGSGLRELPFPQWEEWVPPEVFTFLQKHRLYERMLSLKEAEKYPFLSKKS